MISWDIMLLVLVRWIVMHSTKHGFHSKLSFWILVIGVNLPRVIVSKKLKMMDFFASSWKPTKVGFLVAYRRDVIALQLGGSSFVSCRVELPNDFVTIIVIQCRFQTLASR